MNAIRFLHSSDLHLGRAFGGYPVLRLSRADAAIADALMFEGKGDARQGHDCTKVQISVKAVAQSGIEAGDFEDDAWILALVPHGL